MKIAINKNFIGPEYPPYIVAELSANHNGSLDSALEHVRLAHKAGAHAIKLQTYTAETMTIKSDRPEFKIKDGLWAGYTLYDLYDEAHTPWEWHGEIFELAKSLGLDCFSSPFDESAVDFLESLNTPAYKIASFEMTDLPLIKKIASTGKPIIMSTGMATLDEIQKSISLIKEYHSNLIVLHCVSGYPAPLDQVHLKTMNDIGTRFDVLTGLSDHTLGVEVSLGAIALGAVFIEKHFIASRKMTGPDSSFSIEPHELENLCKQGKSLWKALGDVNYKVKLTEEKNRVFRRSIYVVENVKEGEVFTSKNIRRIRPGYGLEAGLYEEVIGKTARCDIEAGTPLKSNFAFD